MIGDGDRRRRAVWNGLAVFVFLWFLFSGIAMLAGSEWVEEPLLQVAIGVSLPVLAGFVGWLEYRRLMGK